MTKPEALDFLMLLSALESWSFASGKTLPDYLHDRLAASVDVLRWEVLGEQGGGGREDENRGFVNHVAAG